MPELKEKVQKYLNDTHWTTITILADRFEATRPDIAIALTKMLEDQDVRVYGGEIVHV